MLTVCTYMCSDCCYCCCCYEKQVRFRGDTRVLVAECFAFAFDAKDKLLVVDIDGTITKSDVQGLLMTFRYSKHIHHAYCELLRSAFNHCCDFVSTTKLYTLT
jgi:LNS2 (Lipin/Ned1/Smp2)